MLALPQPIKLSSASLAIVVGLRNFPNVQLWRPRLNCSGQTKWIGCRPPLIISVRNEKAPLKLLQWSKGLLEFIFPISCKIVHLINILFPLSAQQRKLKVVFPSCQSPFKKLCINIKRILKNIQTLLIMLLHALHSMLVASGVWRSFSLSHKTKAKFDEKSLCHVSLRSSVQFLTVHQFSGKVTKWWCWPFEIVNRDFVCFPRHSFLLSQKHGNIEAGYTEKPAMETLPILIIF